jgi:hypothetical protein
MLLPISTVSNVHSVDIYRPSESVVRSIIFGQVIYHVIGKLLLTKRSPSIDKLKRVWYGHCWLWSGHEHGKLDFIRNSHNKAGRRPSCNSIVRAP